ncbi:MAG: hypothetical protein LBH07_04185 [Treponema sp.]|nr:hypothetical protein [Treponema sp.]
MNRQTSLIRNVCLLGFVVFLILLGVIIFLSKYGDVPLFSPFEFKKSSFALALEEYDRKIRENPALSFKQHSSLLDSLEKKTLDMENTLSVLKRRRNLALTADSGNQEQYLSSYVQAAARARKLYPHSGQTGALAAEAFIMGGYFSGQAAEILEILTLMTQGSLADLSLAFSVYSGAMGDPATARFLPRELFTLLCSTAQGEEREKYMVNSCIRILFDNKIQEAITTVNGLFNEMLLNDQTILFGSEFFYDHGNYLRSAELFSSFSDSRNLSRQADALWLAGFTGSARGIWQTASAENRNTAAGQEMEESDFPSIKARCYYNLASTSSNLGDSERWLEQLFAVNADYQPGQIFGIIRYSRLLPTDRALAILFQTDSDHEGLFDLELLRRRSEDWVVDKTVAETWMLLNRHTNDSRLFEWAVWYLDFQRRYDETTLALRNAGINQVEGPWSAMHRALALLRSRQYAEAEKTLRNIVKFPQGTKAPGRRTQPLWQAGANLARLLEKQRNYQEALQYYEIAAGQLGIPAGLALEQGTGNQQEIHAGGITQERRDAAKIQVRISSLLRSLGKKPESVRALDYALDLDPENLEARLEKRRLDAERGIL